MTDRRTKLLDELRQNPKDVSPQRLRTVLRGFGFELVRQSGSHMMFEHRDGRALVVPYRRPHVRAVYVRQVIRLLEAAGPQEGVRPS